MGVDPSVSKAKKYNIHSSLMRHFIFIVKNGLLPEEQSLLLEKYSVPDDFAAPVLNATVKEKIGERACKKDSYRFKSQSALSLAVAGLAHTISTINKANKKEIDLDEFLEVLTDVARLLADTHHEMTVARKAFITPRFSKKYCQMLKERKSDKFLFGEDLDAKIDEIRKAQRLLKDTDSSATPKFKKEFQLNFRRPLGVRPPHNRAQNSQFGGRGRPGLRFKRFQQDNQRGASNSQRGKRGNFN